MLNPHIWPTSSCLIYSSLSSLSSLSTVVYLVLSSLSTVVYRNSLIQVYLHVVYLVLSQSIHYSSSIQSIALVYLQQHYLVLWGVYLQQSIQSYRQSWIYSKVNDLVLDHSLYYQQSMASLTQSLSNRSLGLSSLIQGLSPSRSIQGL